MSVLMFVLGFLKDWNNAVVSVQWSDKQLFPLQVGGSHPRCVSAVWFDTGGLLQGERGSYEGAG